MARDPLEAAATPERLRALAAAGALGPEALARALDLVLAPPERAEWRRFLSGLLLAVGALLAVSGVVFFFAYNWADMPRFAKLGLLATLIAAGALGAWRLGLDGPRAQVSLAVAAVLVGALLAVYGQEYQTGADAYGLFLGWAGLILPWAVVACFTPLWLIVVVLLDVGLIAFLNQVLPPGLPDSAPFLLLFGLNGFAWAAFELLERLGAAWLMGRWLHRTLALFSLTSLGVPAVIVIVSPREGGATGVASLLLFLGLLPALYLYFRLVRPDLFMLTLSLTGAMAVFTTLCGRVLLSDPRAEIFGFFALSAIVIVEVGVSALWLLREARVLHRQ